MVFISIVTGANLNQQTYLGGLTLYVSLPEGRSSHLQATKINMIARTITGQVLSGSTAAALTSGPSQKRERGTWGTWGPRGYLVGIGDFLAKNMILGFDLGDRVIIGLENPWNSTMNGLHMLERMDKLVLLDIFLWKFIKHICWRYWDTWLIMIDERVGGIKSFGPQLL